jgi:hypothetical protein
MTKTVQDHEDKDDIGDKYEESSCSESNQTAPVESSPAGDDAQEDKEMKNHIIKREEKAVRNARLLVAAAITVCAVAVSAAIYIFASSSDQATFELDVSNNRHVDYCLKLQHRNFHKRRSNYNSHYILDHLPVSIKATFRTSNL